MVGTHVRVTHLRVCKMLERERCMREVRVEGTGCANISPVTLPRVRRLGEELPTLCWCECNVLPVAVCKIKAGCTESCGAPNCHPPAGKCGQPECMEETA